MKKILRQVYLSPDDIRLIESDLNARQSYVVFSNEEKGTILVTIEIEVAETFKIPEHLLDQVLDGILTNPDERENTKKKEEIKGFLRANGCGV